MAKKIAATSITALLLSGCASTVSPIRVPLASDRASIELCAPLTRSDQAPLRSQIYRDVSPHDRLQWLVCELHAKAQANLDQANEWENRTEWRDIPLLGAAATVAGLLLFGKRDPTTKTLRKRDQDAISIIGFGSAAFATFANYLSPGKARDLLRQGARGHFCLATEGELILSVENSVRRDDDRRALASDLSQLSGALAANEGQFGRPAEAKTIRDAAVKALATYDLQLQQVDTAAVALGETTWNFGIDLLSRSDRTEQKVDQLVQAISEQTASVTKFGQTQQNASNPAPKAIVSAFVTEARARATAPTPDELSLRVADETARLLQGLVNVEALVLGFDKCAATALTGGSPRADRIQRVTLQ